MWNSTTLTTLNQDLGPIPIPRDGYVRAVLQYPTGGTGTLELQGTLNDVNYVTLGLIPSNSTTPVSSLAAAGVASCDVSGYRNVRVRMTVLGSCKPALALPVNV